VIDQFAKICPYCNWDQNEGTPPPEVKAANAAPAYVPPAERSWRRHIIIGSIGIAVLIASFGIGALIQGRSRNKHIEAAAAAATEEDRPTAPVGSAPRADVTLVPVSDMNADTPITSAPVTNPAEGVPTEYQRSDATAVSSVEYAQLAARAQQEKKLAQQRKLVDPRSITGAAYNQGPAAAAPPRPAAQAVPAPQTSAAPDENLERREERREVVRTNPVAEYQPLPDISVRETSVARLELTVGADGRVKDVNIRNGIPGDTAKLIAAVQQWRFKPATENGVPVSATVPVDISFRGRD
jgi:TonB family protein